MEKLIKEVQKKGETVITKEVKELIGMSKPTIIIGDLEKLQYRVAYLEVGKSKANKTDLRKIEARIKWLENELKLIESDGLEDSERDQESNKNDTKVSDKIVKVASTKNNNKKKDKKKVTVINKDNKKDIKKETKKEPKKETKKDTTDNKSIKCELSEIPVITPNKNYYITLETNETFKVIYKDDTTTVLLDSEGVIECDTNKFDKGIVYYFVNKKPYVFSIIESFTK